MVRTLLVAGAVFAATALFDAGPAEAAKSSKNPYSSFNVTGINFGAQRWSREHSGSSKASRRSGGLFGRR